MKKTFSVKNILLSLLFALCANCYLLVSTRLWLLWVLVPLFVLLNFIPGSLKREVPGWRMRVCGHGLYILVAFLPAACVSVIYHTVLFFSSLGGEMWHVLWSALVCIGVLAVVFWNGIVCVYCTSVRLGIKLRVIGALCGMIFPVNLIILGKIINAVDGELEFEKKCVARDKARSHLAVCSTKYPLLLVHGVFFRDFKHFNYWGRVPSSLERNGARVFYGNHQSALTVAESAAELTERVKRIVKETGCEKVNIIAHSKGGLDCRYALSELDMLPYVASLTTVNTPHRGCIYAEKLLKYAPEKFKNKIANTYNAALRKLGDENPDFLKAVGDLTFSACEERNKLLKDPEGIFTRSIGSVVGKAKNSHFPLNLSYGLVKQFDGRNDGLVGENSFQWGSNYLLLEPTGKNGISHMDVIDLSRQDIEGFDVREFYVELVNDLKNRGL